MMVSSAGASNHFDWERAHGVSRGSVCLSKAGSKELAVACEAAKEVVELRFQEVLVSAQGRPLLTSKSCDGAPMQVMHRAQLKPPSGKLV